MQDSDKKEFETIIKATAELYSTVKKVDVSIVVMRLFFSALRKFTIEEVSYGFEQHLGDTVDGKFFPKPANIIKHLQPVGVSTEDKATLAWNQIMREIRVTGAYGSLKLDDKQAIAAIKAVKSWKDLCAMPEKDLTWVKKEFIANYAIYENTPLELLPSSLPGLEELQSHKQEASESMKRIKVGINQHRLNKE
ncbi:MAG: hypothetical protein KAV87_21160 [Desulfobacteraceae bacterium]|nr:hypothetical protein [Desulfobacteraceae bacterium]